MSSWSTRRKTFYGSVVIIAIILFIGVPAFYFLYTPPSCSDGKKNGNELGIDCGGSCVKLCQSSFLPPQIAWGGAKFEKVVTGLYNVAAYIVNPNVSGAAVNVPYKISFYDDRGIFITERQGKMTLSPHRNSLAFETAVNVKQRVLVKAIFEFVQAPAWFQSHDTLEGLAVIDKKYEEENANSSLEVTLENRTLYPYKNIDVSVVLYDSDGNVQGFSKTKIDNINPKNGREIASFTWPINREGKVTSIEVMPVINPVAD
ncbi:MAG: hypothetical protein AAB637_02440 [Patescibacteria group bacterium]